METFFGHVMAGDAVAITLLAAASALVAVAVALILAFWREDWRGDDGKVEGKPCLWKRDRSRDRGARRAYVCATCGEVALRVAKRPPESCWSAPENNWPR